MARRGAQAAERGVRLRRGCHGALQRGDLRPLRSQAPSSPVLRLCRHGGKLVTVWRPPTPHTFLRVWEQHTQALAFSPLRRLSFNRELQLAKAQPSLVCPTLLCLCKQGKLRHGTAASQRGLQSPRLGSEAAPATLQPPQRFPPRPPSVRSSEAGPPAPAGVWIPPPRGAARLGKRRGAFWPRAAGSRRPGQGGAMPDPREDSSLSL